MLSAALCLASCSGMPDESVPSSPVNDGTVATLGIPLTAAALEDVSDLVDRDWVLVAMYGVGGSDPNVASTELRFTDGGDGTGQVSVSGCAAGTFPVSFEPDRVLVFGPSADVVLCGNPADVGQSLPRVLALPLRWSSAEGQELIITRPSTSAFTLVFSEDGRLAPADFCALAMEAIDGHFDFTDPERVAELTDHPGLTDRQRSLVRVGAADAVAEVTRGDGWSTDELVVAINEACGLHLTPSFMVP